MSKSNRKKDSLAHFNVGRIPPNGVPIKLSEETPELSQTIYDMVGFEVSSLNAQLHITSDELAVVKVSGDVSMTLSGCCARCGADISWVHDSTLTMHYAPDSGSRGARSAQQLERIRHEVELEDTELDIGYYQSGRISILDVMGEHIFMEIPSTLRCETEGVIGNIETCSIPTLE